MTLGLSNWREWPKDSYRNLDVSSGRLDAAIVIDSRSIPEKKLINISIGLLEPHKFPAIDRLIRGLGNVKQLHLATASAPWVCCMVMWPVDLFENAQKS
mgnify:FL=1|jgi:hypothetical protein